MTTPRSASAIDSWGLLPLRLVIGLVFLMHGGQKAFVFGLDGTTGAMTSMGIPFPQLAAIVVATAELLGGLAVLLGVFARWAGLALAIDMAVAVLAVRLPGGFFAPTGFEFELTLLGGALTIAALGSGGFSLDRVIRRGNQRAASTTP